jgi:hypothetical protein
LVGEALGVPAELVQAQPEGIARDALSHGDGDLEHEMVEASAGH